METIALNTKGQKKLNKRVNKIKSQLRNGLKLKENGIKRELKGKKKRSNEGRGVIYIGHIPHGFYEDEIRSYCSQFGKVTRLRVARSRRTGRSKGFAFVEFQHAEVAKIVADTMNNYLMFNRLLSCHYIPEEKRHMAMFWSNITADSYPKIKCRAKSTTEKNKQQKDTKEEKAKQKARRKIEEFKKFFEERGIEFNFKINDPTCDMTQISEEPAVLEIDESDDEVEFSSPAHVKTIFKRSSKLNPVRPLPGKRAKRTEIAVPNAFSAKRNKGH